MSRLVVQSGMCPIDPSWTVDQCCSAIQASFDEDHIFEVVLGDAQTWMLTEPLNKALDGEDNKDWLRCWDIFMQNGYKFTEDDYNLNMVARTCIHGGCHTTLQWLVDHNYRIDLTAINLWVMSPTDGHSAALLRCILVLLKKGYNVYEAGNTFINCSDIKSVINSILGLFELDDRFDGAISLAIGYATQHYSVVEMEKAFSKHPKSEALMDKLNKFKALPKMGSRTKSAK